LLRPGPRIIKRTNQARGLTKVEKHCRREPCSQRKAMWRSECLVPLIPILGNRWSALSGFTFRPLDCREKLSPSRCPLNGGVCGRQSLSGQFRKRIQIFASGKIEQILLCHLARDSLYYYYYCY